jgi:predicted Zn-dependent protease
VAALAGKPFDAVAAGYSRDQEREADTLGQPLAAAAGFDPPAMARIRPVAAHGAANGAALGVGPCPSWSEPHDP